MSENKVKFEYDFPTANAAKKFTRQAKSDHRVLSAFRSKGDKPGALTRVTVISESYYSCSTLESELIAKSSQLDGKPVTSNT